jgi:hypothetical protein
MVLEEIKKMLDRGDYVKIARMAGYTDLKAGRTYVYDVMSGRIQGKRGIGKKILEAAHTVANLNAETGKSAIIE